MVEDENTILTSDGQESTQASNTHCYVAVQEPVVTQQEPSSTSDIWFGISTALIGGLVGVGLTLWQTTTHRKRDRASSLSSVIFERYAEFRVLHRRLKSNVTDVDMAFEFDVIMFGNWLDCVYAQKDRDEFDWDLVNRTGIDDLTLKYVDAVLFYASHISQLNNSIASSTVIPFTSEEELKKGWCYLIPEYRRLKTLKE